MLTERICPLCQFGDLHGPPSRLLSAPGRLWCPAPGCSYHRDEPLGWLDLPMGCYLPPTPSEAQRQAWESASKLLGWSGPGRRVRPWTVTPLHGVEPMPPRTTLRAADLEDFIVLLGLNRPDFNARQIIVIASPPPVAHLGAYSLTLHCGFAPDGQHLLLTPGGVVGASILEKSPCPSASALTSIEVGVHDLDGPVDLRDRAAAALLEHGRQSMAAVVLAAPILFGWTPLLSVVSLYVRLVPADKAP